MNINENDFFRQATLRICGHLEIEKALHECLRYLQTIIPTDLICLEIYEPDISSLRIIAKATPERYRKTDILIPMDNESKRLLDKIYKKFMVSGLPNALIINDPDKDPAAKLIMAKLNRHDASFLHMALETAGRPLCSILIAVRGKNRYNDEDARLVSLLKDPFSIAMSNTLKHLEVIHLKELLADDNQFLHRQLLDLSGNQIIGADFGLKKVMEMVRQVADHDIPVLLTGETGTGKDVIANATHYLSSRKNAPFIAVNCGAIPENLLDSELFGHEKGAFTGAVSRKRGRFERADKGTIFLDEIGELPPQAQVRLLRVLQHKEIERVGGTQKIPLNIRVIAATNKNLEEMITSGLFREDLWFRLNVFPIKIPPLRERKDDIPAFVRYFIEKKSKDLKFPSVPKLEPGAMKILTDYNWPGNVREMENIVERALILSKEKNLSFEHLKQTGDKKGICEQKPDDSFPKFDQVISDYILEALKHTKGKIHGDDGAAQLMGINPSTLRSRIKKLGIRYN